LRHKPRVLFVGLGETDEWGHARRYDLYLDAAYNSDRFLAELWETVQRMPEYKDRTTLLLTTDHGRGTTRVDWTDHGKNVPDAEYMWMAALGPDTQPLGVRENLQTTQGQVASTIAALLGENFCAASVRAASPLPDVCALPPGAVAAAVRSAPAKEPKFVKTTYTYKTVGPTKVEADLYRADDTQVRPVVVWLHGGALIVGSRAGPPQRLLDLCRDEGFALVSLDYRLAPEVKLPAIVEDVEDAFVWLRGQAAKLHLDTSRLVVAGGSAGGYLTLLTGYRVKPRPTALVAYWGYGDVDGDWYTKPSEHYRRQPLVGKDEAYRAVGGKVLTGTTAGEEQKGRSRFYLYLRQNGLWTREVAGLEPGRDKGKLDRFCGVRNVTADYPPTMLVHGTEDTDVPYDQSAAMAKELERHRVPHELVTVKGAGHGLSGGDKKLVDEAHEKALAFIRRHLKPAGK
jgi:acetyl esterase/lipase